MNLNKKRIGFVTAWLISLLTVGTIVYVVYAQTASTFWITEGIYPSSTSYVIWQEGANFYAKNEYGIISYSGTNESIVIQNTLDVLTSGGIVHIKSGDYNVVTLSVTNSYITIQGDGNSGNTVTRLILEDNTDANMFNIFSATMFTIRDIKLSGNTANNALGIGIAASYAHGGSTTGDMLVERVFIEHFAEEGIYWDDAWGSQIVNSYIEYNDGYGARITGQNVLIHSTTFSFNTLSGLRLAGGGTSIPVSSSVVNSVFVENEQHGIYVSGTDGSTISSSLFQGNGVSSANTYDAIHINGGQNITVMGNVIHANTTRDIIPSIRYTRCGVRVESQFPVTVIGNTFSNLLNVGVYTAYGGNVITYGNIGFLTQNSGSASLATGNTITHNLTGTPTSVILTLTVSEDIWVTAVGSSTFTINFDGGGTQTVYWYAEYKL